MSTASVSLSELQELYDAGQYQTVFEKTKNWGEIHQWDGVDKKVFGGKLANNLGAPRYGRTIHIKIWQENPRHPEAVFCALWGIGSRRGPIRALQLDKKIGDVEGDDPIARADRYAMRSHFYAMVRDFEVADEWIKQAIELAPQRSWIHVEKAGILHLQDKTTEALEVTAHALELQPFYRPAVQSHSYTLVQENRDDEALELLTAAAEKLQSGDILAQLIALYQEQQQFEKANEYLQQIEPYFPLLHRDKTMQKWLHGKRSDISFHLGDYETAKQEALQADSPFLKSVAENIEKNKDGKRVLLDLEFVRQNYVTCAPATLTAIAKYWEKPVDHLELAEEICYDGTPAHEARKWADDNGYLTVEFKVTWESSVALLDRGIPFTLSTIGPGAAHIQPIIGYDARRGVLLVRDPGERHQSEFLAEKMLEYFSSTGPRGMVMVPKEQVSLLDGIELEDAQLYDENYQIQFALKEHRRADALQHLQNMTDADPENRLTIFARASIANYDADQPALLKLTNQLLEQFPDDVNQLNCKIGLLGELGYHEELMELLEDLCAREKTHPMFWHHLASELLNDYRKLDEAEYWIRRSMRHQPVDAHSIHMLSVIRSQQQRYEDELQLKRFAACLEDTKEFPAQVYFANARFHGHQKTAVKFLQDRFNRFATTSSLPARTLTNALDSMNMTEKALMVLEKGLAKRPDDSDLMLFASEFYGVVGKTDKEREYLEMARGKCKRNDWFRAAVRYSINHGQMDNALKLLDKILLTEPLDIYSHRQKMQILSDQKGMAAAESHLKEIVEKFPFQLDLRQLLIEFYQEESKPKLAEKELRDFLKRQPENPWAARELAVNLMTQYKYDEAHEYAKVAIKTDPINPASHHFLGETLRRLGRIDEAKQSFRKAIQFAVDVDLPINALMQTCETKAERLEVIEFLESELSRQTTLGDGLLAFHDHASRNLEAKPLLAKLRKMLNEHPQLWQAWAAVIRQLVQMDEPSNALKVAQKAVDKFPLSPPAWQQLAMIHRSQNDTQQEIETLKKAIELNHTWLDGVRELADAYMRHGDLNTALTTINRAIKYESRSPINLTILADIQWRLNQRDEAIQSVSKAVQEFPGYDWAWDTLNDWAHQMQKPDLPIQIAKSLCAKRPHDIRPRLRLAEFLEREPDRFDERLQMIQQALEIDPLNEEIHQQLAMTYAANGQYAEALQACNPKSFGENRPKSMRATEAEVVAMSGEIDRGIELMKRTLDDDPDYIFGWMKLADWYEALGNQEEYVKCASNMVRVLPHSEVSNFYYAEAMLRTNRRPEAEKFYEKAIDANKEYMPAVMSLLDLHLEDKRFGRAHNLFEKVSPGMEPAWAASVEAQINCGLKNWDQMFAALQQLRTMSSEHGNPVVTAMELILDDDQIRPRVIKFLNDLKSKPDTNPDFGMYWGRARFIQSLEDERYPLDGFIEELNQMDHTQQFWIEAVSEFLPVAGEIDTGLAEFFIQQLGSKITANNQTWVAAGDAFQRNAPQRCVEWMSNWQTRNDINPRDLMPLALAQWDLKNATAAGQVSLAALSLPPDHTVPAHHTFKALEQTIGGSLEVARQHISQAANQSMPNYYLMLSELIQIVLSGCGQYDPPLNYAQADHHISDIVNSIPPEINDKMTKRVIKQLRKRLAKENGKFFAMLRYSF